MITAESENDMSTITRNASHFKSIPKSAPRPIIIKEEEDFSIDDPQPQQQLIINNPPPTRQNINQEQMRKVYPKRTRKPVNEWRKY